MCMAWYRRLTSYVMLAGTARARSCANMCCSRCPSPNTPLSCSFWDVRGWAAADSLDGRNEGRIGDRGRSTVSPLAGLAPRRLPTTPGLPLERWFPPAAGAALPRYGDFENCCAMSFRDGDRRADLGLHRALVSLVACAGLPASERRLRRAFVWLIAAVHLCAHRQYA